MEQAVGSRADRGKRAGRPAQSRQKSRQGNRLGAYSRQRSRQWVVKQAEEQAGCVKQAGRG